MFSFGLDTRSRYKGIGGEFMPRVYAAVLCFCAVVQLVSGVKEYIEEMKKASEEEKAEEKKKLDSSIKNVAICFVIIIAYFGLMK
ncbi:MAG: hypothetical protein ACI4S4_02860, partial [Candidatus Ornithospirochaeta sp.]